jgi:hypothetical protein
MNNRQRIEHINSMKQQLAKNMSDSDIKHYLGDCVMVYPDLKKYKKITELLPIDKSYKVILLETKPNYGHFFCICRYGNILETFDSYGRSIKKEFSYVPKMIQKILGEKEDELDNLMDTADEDFDIIYNNHRLQSTAENINTCGKWCIFRLQMLRDLDYTLEEFLGYVEKECDERGLPPDILVCNFVK